jgi:hypothetical protein
LNRSIETATDQEFGVISAKAAGKPVLMMWCVNLGRQVKIMSASILGMISGFSCGGGCD